MTRFGIKTRGRSSRSSRRRWRRRWGATKRPWRKSRTPRVAATTGLPPPRTRRNWSPPWRLSRNYKNAKKSSTSTPTSPRLCCSTLKPEGWMSTTSWRLTCCRGRATVRLLWVCWTPLEGGRLKTSCGWRSFEQRRLPDNAHVMAGTVKTRRPARQIWKQWKARYGRQARTPRRLSFSRKPREST